VLDERETMLRRVCSEELSSKPAEKCEKDKRNIARDRGGGGREKKKNRRRI
tara:strand:+ start:568 stop:720 length:153 start_codon:yes stop_codon:yes gene_type:complete